MRLLTEDAPAAVFGLLAMLLLANVWLSVRSNRPPKRPGIHRSETPSSDAKP